MDKVKINYSDTTDGGAPPVAVIPPAREEKGSRISSRDGCQTGANGIKNIFDIGDAPALTGSQPLE